MEQSIFPGPVVNPAIKLEFCPKTNGQMFQNETKCAWEFPPKVAGESHRIFMGGNHGRGRFQFFQPRHWRCPCMVLTLVIHRQLTSLAEIFDGLFHTLHNILPANSGGTLDKSRFSGNKSLHEENDLMKKTFDDPFAHKFHAGGNSPLPPARWLPYFDSCFSSSIDKPDRESRPLGA